MVWYKDGEYFDKVNHVEFNQDHSPGIPAPFSGIYRCMGCHREVASNEKQPLPPKSHHQHINAQGKIRWRLVAFADHKTK